MEAGYKSSPAAQEWLLNNHSRFQEWVKNNMKKAFQNQNGDVETCSLFDYQRFVKNFFGSDSSPYRGILLYHGLGTGKTITSIASAESLSNDNKDIIVMLPASLTPNYMSEIMQCGNDAFSKDKKWKFYAQGNEKYEKMAKNAKKMGVDAQLLKKQKGVWSFTHSKQPNYEKLSDDERTQVKKQIETMILRRYMFIHYNGLTRNKLVQLAQGKNIFDNKVVVIDEVHNFLSAVKNKSQIRSLVFEMLMEAKNVKIIALSGTPIINDPFELAFLGNLLKGYIRRFVFHLQPKTTLIKHGAQIMKYLEENTSIDHFDATADMSKVDIIFVPPGFRRVSKDTDYVSRQFDNETYQDMIDKLHKELEQKFSVGTRSTSEKKAPLFPLKQKDFNNMFVANKGLQNVDLLSRRLQGVVSYYESFDRSQFPQVNDLERVYVKMSKEMFERYLQVRQTEKSNELNNRPDEEEDEKSSLNYKTFSRALSLFRFPNEIQRVYPSNMKELIDDGEEGDIANTEMKEQQDVNDIMKKMYKDMQKNIMSTLRKNAHRFLSDEGLQMYGPKYLEIMERARASKGPVLIYSQFRQVEGIGIMQEVLRENAHYQLDIKKNMEGEWELEIPKVNKKWDKPFYIVFTQSKEKNNVLLEIYNNTWHNLPDTILKQLHTIKKHRGLENTKENNLRGAFVKFLLITQSGSEGISLRNVRQIHILEPYWNPVRIKQIIGRASRVESHAQLPIEDQVVEPFIYIMTLDKSQNIEFDGNMTSDQMIMNIVDRKSIFIQQIQEIMQRNAIDCPFHLAKHPHMDTCFTFPHKFGKFAYVLDDIQHDIPDRVFAKKMKKAKRQIPTHGNDIPGRKTIRSLTNERTGKRFYFIEETLDVIEPRVFDQTHEFKVIGKLLEMDGVLHPRFYQDNF